MKIKKIKSALRMKTINCVLLFLFTSQVLSAQLRPFKQDGKWGFEDASGKVVVAPQFGTAEPFTLDGMAKVGNKEGTTWKYGMVDATGKLAVPIVYDKLGRRFSDNLLLVSQNGKWGFVNKSGQTIVPLTYEDAQSFTEERAAVKVNGKWGFIDPNGNVKIPPAYDEAGPFAGRLSEVRLNRKEGFIDINGKAVTEIKYDDIVYGAFADPLYAVKLN